MILDFFDFGLGLIRSDFGLGLIRSGLLVLVFGSLDRFFFYLKSPEGRIF